MDSHKTLNSSDESIKIYNDFLFGFFTNYLDNVKNTKAGETDLGKYCYFQSLLYLNKFDECLKYLEFLDTQKDPAKGKTLIFNFKLFAFDCSPTIYSKNYSNGKTYSDNFNELLKEFDEIQRDHYNKENIQDPFWGAVFIDIFSYILSISETFFEKFGENKYLDIKRKIFPLLQEMEQYYSDPNSLKEYEKESSIIWRSLILCFLGDIYSYYDESKKITLYEQSLSLKPNIFALDRILDHYTDDKDAEKALLYFENFKETIEYNPSKTEYYFLNVVEPNKDLIYSQNIQFIEELENNNILDSYPYYNFALLKQEKRRFKDAEHYLKKAIEILEKITDIELYKISEVDKKEKEILIYFIDDVRDYLYEICKCQINQKNKKAYKETIQILENIKFVLPNEKEKIQVDYDITLLKSKIVDLKENYRSLVKTIEGFLDDNDKKDYLSKKEISDLKSRLAYGYLKLQDPEKYNELIQEAIELDPQNEFALRLISIVNQQTDFLSKTHGKEILKGSVIACCSLGVALGVAYFLSSISHNKKANSYILLAGFIVFSLIIVITYIRPIIRKVNIKGIMEIEFLPLSGSKVSRF
jgi:hypothetical protein